MQITVDFSVSTKLFCVLEFMDAIFKRGSLLGRV